MFILKVDLHLAMGKASFWTLGTLGRVHKLSLTSGALSLEWG